MSDIDHERIHHLLEIAKHAAMHGGKLAHLGNWAYNELLTINAEIKAAAIQRAIETDATLPSTQEPGDAEPEDDDPDTIHTADNPNPNLVDRRL